jgi:hypothetical protein
MSRGLPAAFPVNDSAPRERYRCDYVSTNISFLRNAESTKPDRFQKPVRFTNLNDEIAGHAHNDGLVKQEQRSAKMAKYT